MFKRILTFVGASLMLLALAACGGSAAPTAAPAPVAATPTTVAAQPTNTTAAAPPTATTASAAVPTATAAVAGAATDTPGSGTSASAPTATSSASGAIPPTATAATSSAAPTATTATMAQPTAAASAVPSTTAQIFVVAVVTPPPPQTLALTPPALPTMSAFGDTPGSSADSAVAVSPPVSITEVMSEDASGDGQWFKLDLSAYKGGMLELDLSNPASSTDYLSMAVYDETGQSTYQSSSANAGETDHEVVELADSAIYTVRVYGTATTDPYGLLLNFHPKANNSAQDAAAPIGLSSAISGYMNATHEEQWFQLDTTGFPQGGELTFTVSTPRHENDSLYMSLFDRIGESTLASTSVEASKTDSMKYEVNEGDVYKFQLRSEGGYDWTEPYTLTVAFAPHSAYYSPDTAVAVPALPVEVSAQMSSPRDIIYLSIKVAGPLKLTATVSSPADNGYTVVSITDAKEENTFASSSLTAGKDTAIEGDISDPGTYLLKLNQDGNDQVSKQPLLIKIETSPLE